MGSITNSYSKEYSIKSAEVLCECFRKDPVFTWLTYDLSVERRQAWFPRMHSAMMDAAHGGGARFYEVDGWSGCTVVFGPGKRIDGLWNMLRAGIVPMMWHIGLGGIKRALIDYEGASDRLRNKTLGKEECYYVFGTGTLAEHRGKGLCSETMRQIQDHAEETGHTVWLEATTPASKSIYSKLGWVTVDEIKLGVGVVGADGFQKTDGEGVTIWGMYWKPGEKRTAV